MGRVVERCAFSRHNYIGKQGIFGMHMCAASGRRLTNSRLISVTDGRRESRREDISGRVGQEN
jgi:hypothetical protein